MSSGPITCAPQNRFYILDLACQAIQGNVGLLCIFQQEKYDDQSQVQGKPVSGN